MGIWGVEMMWGPPRQCEDDMVMTGMIWGQCGDHRAYGGVGMMWG